MYNVQIRKYVKVFGFLCMCLGMIVSPAYAMKAPTKPTYPPLEGEYYPVDPETYPQKMANPYAHIRTVPFEGKVLDIYCQINMLTEIQFPAPPVIVGLSRPDKFTVSVVPEQNFITIQPIEEVDMASLMVRTERGVYHFVVKENPWKPYDARVVVTDPYRRISPTDTQTLLWMAYNGVRPPELQFYPLEIRDPGSSQFIYDPVTKLSARVTLRRALLLPRHKKAVYWVEIANIIPPEIREQSSPVSFMVDERSVYVQGLEKIAVPGTASSGYPLLARGDKVDMFIVSHSASIPASLKIRFMLQGSPRDLPIEVMLPTINGTGKTTKINALSPVDQRLQKMYDEQMKKNDIPTIQSQGETLEQPETSSSSDAEHFQDTRQGSNNDGIVFVEP